MLERAPVIGAPAPTSAPASPESKLLERLDAALAHKQFATTLELIATAPAALRANPAVCCRAAEAHLGLGQALGKTTLRIVADGRPGQFDGGWLLVEKRPAADTFLCAPPESAIVQVRRAIDGGFDEPRVHAAHARAWLKANQPETAWSILKAREAVLLDEPALATLEAFAEVSLARGSIEDFLKYSNLRAERSPDERVEILHAAYLAAAERYNQRGDVDLNRALLHRALALKAERPDLMLQLADALWEAGEKAAASHWYRRIMDLQPAHGERNRILERLGE
jgi:tetratricopeptide (TPR) repeat protein